MATVTEINWQATSDKQVGEPSEKNMKDQYTILIGQTEGIHQFNIAHDPDLNGMVIFDHKDVRK